MATFRNDKSGEMVTVPQSKAELLLMFEEAPNDHWLWFHLARYAARANEPASQPARTDMIAFLADSFLLACGNGLKRPMIRLHYGPRRYKIYLSQRGTLCFKSGRLAVDPSSPPGSPVVYTSDPVGDEEYIGCLHSGRFLTPSASRYGPARPLLPCEREVIDSLSTDPVGFLARCSKDMCRCCYCALPLEDARSKDVGYGPICAGRWGLPWGKSYDEKIPSFAQLWAGANPSDQRSIRGICGALRQNPQDTFLWSILRDALRDAGHVIRTDKDGTEYPCAPGIGVRVCTSS